MTVLKQTLENPILADNVYSRYELEYLTNNVRRSEDVGRENYVYLHYACREVFCAYLQCLNMRPLLENRKPVFLIGDEIARYPIDFKARFGIDCSQYPLRRFTTSHAASVKFMYEFSLMRNRRPGAGENVSQNAVSDVISKRIFDRGFMIDPEDQLYKDSVLVRFEDGKLNPKATFTALAAFLDLPYTKSMTYCSENGRLDPHPDTKGFDSAPAYKSYDNYANNAERCFIEYFLRDAYEYYGYDFYYYDGAPADGAKVMKLLSGFVTIDHYIRITWKRVFDRVDVSGTERTLTPEEAREAGEQFLETYVESFKGKRLYHTQTLMSGLRFVSRSGQPLWMMRKLEPDPALLEQPLYY